MTQSILNPSLLMTSDIFQRLLANYESKWLLNPLRNSRLRSVVTARQCLSYILKKKLDLGSSDIGRLLKQGHATQIYSDRVVGDMIHIRDESYLREIVKWSEIFDEVLPNNAIAEHIMTEKVRVLLDAYVSDKSISKRILEKLIKEY